MKVLCLILGGGRGTRLWPLTKNRAKPAVPIGGKYRLIDISLSNCLNSGLHHVAVLTQFNSVSLNRHITRSYNFDVFHTGWVEILAAEQKDTMSDWYQGTADAVRKHLDVVRSYRAREIVILAGDHLYRMDYSHLLRYHREQGAAITIAVKPVSRRDTSRFGILKQARDGRITAFSEKPGDNADQLRRLLSTDDPQLPFLASMGIYVFQTDILRELLDSNFVDFGRDVIPAAINCYEVYGYRFDGYWEDIGTIRSFYEANLALVQATPPFTFYDADWPVYTRPRFLPGSHLHNVTCERALVSDGCIIRDTKIQTGVIGNHSVIEPNVVIRDSVLMGASQYGSEAKQEPSGLPAIGIGKGSRITGAIIDRDVRIGAGVEIAPFPPGTNLDKGNWSVRDGVVVIPHHAVIPERTFIAPS